MDIDEERKKELLRKSNVVAAGEGEKITNGQNTGEECVSVLVANKHAPEDISPENMVPEEVDGNKTDVVEVGTINAEMPLKNPESTRTGDQSLNTTLKRRPFSMGMSVGHKDITAGTAGFIAWRDAEYEIGSNVYEYAKPVLVSNNHVLANENKGEVGDSILQPGPYDGGQNIDGEFRIGGLRDYVELDNEGNLVDAAYCDLEGRYANSFVPRLGVPTETVEVSVGDTVEKFGRTTGYRKGEVKVTGARVRVNFGDLGVLEFEDQIITSDMSAPGDSGSAGVKTRKLFGLLFAGSSTVTVFNKADNVLDELGLRLEP